MRRAVASALLAFLVLSVAGCAGAREGQAPPSSVPARTVAAMDGGAVDLGAALDSGRSVMLVFWQTWCETCLEEAPVLAQAAREHAGEWLLVGIVPGPDGTVDEAELRRLVELHDLPYPQLRDRDLAWSEAFAVAGTPTLVALRPDGRAGWRSSRPPADWSALHASLRAAP